MMVRLVRNFDKSVNAALFAVAAGLSLSASACGRTPAGNGFDFIATQTWTVDALADVGLHSSLAIDPRGTAQISYYDLTNGDLKYAIRDPNDASRFLLNTVDSVGDVGAYSALAIDQKNLPHILYHDKTNNRAKYAYKNDAGGWVVQSPDGPSGGRFGSIALDVNDLAYLVYVAEPAYSLEYAVCDPLVDACMGYSLDNGTLTTGKGGQINGGTNLLLRRVGNSEEPLVVYYQASYGLLQMMYFEPGHQDAFGPTAGPRAGWVPKILDGDITADARKQPDVGLFVAAAIEPTGPTGDEWLHVAHYDAEKQDLRYVRYNLTTQVLEKEIVDSSGVVGQGIGIALIPRTDRHPIAPIITYYDATFNQLKIAIRTFDDQQQPRSWRIASLAMLDNSGRVFGDYPSMVALPYPDRIAVSYYNFGIGEFIPALRYTEARIP